MKNFLPIFFAMIILIAGCSNANEPSVAVSVAKVQTLEGKINLTYGGKISLSDTEKIFPAVSGNVLATYFTAGADVTENQPLFKVGKQQDETELLQAKTALAESMTALAKELAEKNPKATERQAEIAELQEKIKQLEEDSALGIVRAPKSGKIGAEFVKIGAPVKADETVLATVGKNNPATVRFEVSAQEKNFLAASNNLKVTIKFTDGTRYPHEGTLRFDDLTAEATFDNSEELLTPGADVEILLEGVNVPKVLLIPESAIFLRGEENFVFVVAEDKTAVEKKILLGGTLNNLTIVQDGLKADDSVVVEDLTNLREGTPLSVTNDK